MAHKSKLHRRRAEVDVRQVQELIPGQIQIYTLGIDHGGNDCTYPLNSVIYRPIELYKSQPQQDQVLLLFIFHEWRSLAPSILPHQQTVIEV